jgi:hypothetical protein
VAARVLSWFGPKGGRIGVGFDDEHFGCAEMQVEIDFMQQAHPSLPDEVPPGTSFVFFKEGTGHLSARFRVGDTVYRGGAERSLRRLWETVHLIEQLVHPARYRSVS